MSANERVKKIFDEIEIAAKFSASPENLFGLLKAIILKNLRNAERAAYKRGKRARK